MYRIAIVEDTERDYAQLSEHISRFGKEKELEIEVIHFPNAIQFLRQYHGDFQVVMMDIDMPVLNGMDAAHRLREIDPSVVLVFVTALARFAVNGYEVNAFDFIVKPIAYPLFVSKMTRILKQLASTGRKKLLIHSGEKAIRVYEDEIIYVDIQGHTLTFHTERQNVTTRGSMKDAVEALDEEFFAMCNKSCLLNLHRIDQISGDEAVMDNGDRIQISRPRKTEFMQHIADFYANKKINMGRF